MPLRHGGPTIMPGVELGEGAVVGAHSLAMKSCLPWSIYFGVPAERLKARSQKLLESTEQFREVFAAAKASGPITKLRFG